jgi:hypothetical protein
MTIGYRWMVTMGCVLAIVLGIGIGTKFSQWARSMDSQSVWGTGLPPEEEAAAPSDTGTQPAVKAPAQLRVVSALPRVSPDAPELLGRLQPLLNKGADMNIAAEGFRDAETFAAVAHAARNTEVPFMVLKHQVVNRRKPLDKAIAELKPTVNAPIEANRARAEARSDIAGLAG